MQTTKNFKTMCLCTGLFAASLAITSAQVTATWIGPASGGEWNTMTNWDIGVPGSDVNGMTNAFIGTGTNVNYNLPMVASSFGILTNNGILNINTNGFNCSSIIMAVPGGGDELFITNSGAAANVSGNFNMGTNTVATLAAGASLTVGALNVDNGTSSKASGTSYFTNSGGILMASSTSVNSGSGTGTGLLMIGGGTNNLGNIEIGRYNSGSASTLGKEGLAILGGLVTMTNLNVGGGYSASYDTAYITGGTITNFGSVFLNNATAGRYSRLLQTGGLFVVPDPGVVNPNSTVAGAVTAIYSVTGGTNIVGGLFFGNSNTLVAATAYFTNGAVIYIGSQGIAANGVSINTIFLNGGAMFGATTSWMGSAPMSLGSGTFTFQTADMNNSPNNITLSAALSGVGNLNVTGGGTLTLGAANTYSGNTLINGGTLALSAGGSVTSPDIIVSSGTIFDVSQVSGFTLNGSQTLSGFGTVTGAVAAATSSTIYPGSNSVTGTLTFTGTGGLTENGGVNNEFNLSSNSSGPNNDFINASGGLTLSGTNTIVINGSLASGSAYPLINYGGSLVGSITNLTVTGATGTLSNSPTAQTIYFIAQTSVRGPTNITWVGNAVANNWDTEITTNWFNNGTGLLDLFVPNDNALFSNLGATNSTVNIAGSVSPGSITINTTSNYTFTGNGVIGGVGSLTVSNGTLTVLTTNTYSGQTVLDGGVLATPIIANSGSPSGIGAASSDPGNFIFNGGTLSYFGASAETDHGMTLTNFGGTIDTSNSTTLTLNGNVTGDGTLTVTDSGTLILASGNSYTNTTTIAGGNLQLNNAAGAGAGGITFSNGTLIYYPSGGITVANPFNFVAGTTNTVTVTSGSGANPISSGDWSGGGIVQINDTYNPYTVNGSLDAFTGTVLLTTPNGAAFRFNSSGGNTSFGSTNATFDLGNGSGILTCRNAGTINLGALQGGSGTFVQGQGSGAGTIIWSIGNNNLNTAFSGTIEDHAANEISAVTKIGSGTLSLAGNNTYSGTTAISNGVLALAYNSDTGSDGAIGSSTNIYVAAGAFMDVSSRSDGTLPLNSNQQLGGTGTILGNLDTSSGGTVAPGDGLKGNTGTLTVTNSITLGGTTWMKLNRANSPNSDQLVSSLSTITYGGTLVVTNIGATLQPGDTFTLFSGAALDASTFGSIIFPDYTTWDTSQLGVNGTVTFTGLASPDFSGIDYSQLANGSITINATNGIPNGPVAVLTSTNLALPLSSWTTNTMTAFDGSGNLNIPITVDPALPQQFIILQAQ
jgi:autotransporter-associated beta strand protein